MDMSVVDQYFELALDLTERKRNDLLRKLDQDQPQVASELRRLLTNSNKNVDFACQSGASTNRGGKLDTLHHVAIRVDHIATAVAWYRGKFACEIEYHDATWAMLRFSNFRLALVLPGEHPPHVAVCSEEAAVFGELKTHRDGSRSTYLEDPWGNAVEVIDSASL